MNFWKGFNNLLVAFLLFHSTPVTSELIKKKFNKIIFLLCPKGFYRGFKEFQKPFGERKCQKEERILFNQIPQQFTNFVKSGCSKIFQKAFMKALVMKSCLDLLWACSFIKITQSQVFFKKCFAIFLSNSIRNTSWATASTRWLVMVPLCQHFVSWFHTQPAFTCSKSTMETIQKYEISYVPLASFWFLFFLTLNMFHIMF